MDAAPCTAAQCKYSGQRRQLSGYSRRALDWLPLRACVIRQAAMRLLTQGQLPQAFLHLNRLFGQIPLRKGLSSVARHAVYRVHYHPDAIPECASEVDCPPTTFFSRRTQNHSARAKSATARAGLPKMGSPSLRYEASPFLPILQDVPPHTAQGMPGFFS